MNERAKITASHLSRQPIVYRRQSGAAQVEHNRESTDRQYALAAKARELGWPNDRIIVIDEDLGLSGSGFVARSGFARLTALGRLTDTLSGDADGIYHPALFNDRLLLGLKGTMSEAELHVLRARLDQGKRHKAERGELYTQAPGGYVCLDSGEVALDPDQQVQAVVRLVFEKFAELGAGRAV